MRIHNLLRLLFLTGVGVLISAPRGAYAQWPTIDIAAIKEGITTNIELVKQSKIVTDAMVTAGKINAGIGDAKASFSKYAGDNLAKAKERMEKVQAEKERIEGKRKKFDKVEADLEEKKKDIEEARARAKKAEADLGGKIKDAKAEKEKDAKEAAKETKESVTQIKKDMAAKVDNVKPASVSNRTPSEALTSDSAKDTVPAAASSRTAFGTPDQNPEVAVPNSDDKDYEEEMLPQDLDTPLPVEDVVDEEKSLTPKEEEIKLKQEKEELERQKSELEVDAMLAKTPEEKAAVEAKKAELETKQKELETLQGKDQDKNKKEEAEKKEPQPFHRAKILDGETSTKMAIPEATRPKILDTYQAPVAHRPKILDQAKPSSSTGGFRKRAVPAKTSAVESGVRYASRSFSETLVFANAGIGEFPDGTVNGVFILSDRLAQECNVNVKNLEDEKVMDECIKKLVSEKSSKDGAVSQEANAIYRTIMQETVNALIAESMAQKNVAANYETKVLEKMEKTIANTKDSRGDTGGLSLTNKELQYLLNRILVVYSAQLSLDALTKVGGFDSSYYEDTKEDGEGEKK